MRKLKFRLLFLLGVLASILPAQGAPAAVHDVALSSDRVAGAIFRVIDVEGRGGWGMVFARASGEGGQVFVRICRLLEGEVCAEYSAPLTSSEEFVTSSNGSSAFLTVDEVPGLGALNVDLWVYSRSLWGAGCEEALIGGGFEIQDEWAGLAYIVNGGKLGPWSVNGGQCGAVALDASSELFGI